ncbi:MAG TPA: penicillin-binding transpeptidase domain-containing protein, partial [Candidatus Limnocylindria bacterium]|nr:penicillin-binding transpeptidase domain-containing protein [Candidatus Limnocylindria bacterium]
RDLRGSAGAKRILVNSGGYRVGESMFAEPVPGKNLYTTIDLDVQIAAEKALASVNGDERGAVVVMDVRNGDILAMASAPTYPPQEWIDGFDLEHYNTFYSDPVRRPQINRATMGAYNPGSTFKIVTALAAFERGLDPDATFTVEGNPFDPGHGGYRLGNRMIGDRAAPGVYNFHRAFIHSSNSYFIDQGLKMGFDPLMEMAHRFHLGERTQLQLSPREEGIGEVPEVGEAKREGWPQGKLANFSIGQEVTVTPIQMACMISAVANGGTVYWPRLVDRIENASELDDSQANRIRQGQVRTKLSIKRQYFDWVRAAMRDDVLSDEGTGKGARIKGYNVCGKTGTAEIKGNGIKDKVTWFTSFAPYEDPRYTIIVVIESGASGGGTCAPVARQIYEFVRDRDSGLKGAVSGL